MDFAVEVARLFQRIAAIQEQNEKVLEEIRRTLAEIRVALEEVKEKKEEKEKFSPPPYNPPPLLKEKEERKESPISSNIIVGKGVQPNGKSRETNKPPKIDAVPHAMLLDATNRILGTRYRLTQTIRGLFRARWREGFRVEDFLRVLDTMTAAWGSDPKMSQYLRPQTLFGPKMDSYLNWRKPDERPKGGSGPKYGGINETIDLENPDGSDSG